MLARPSPPPTNLYPPFSPKPPTTSLSFAALPRRSLAVAVSIRGPCFVVGDDITSEQIAPADGKPHLFDLPANSCPVPFQTGFRVVIAGANFGGGSAGDRAVAALQAAGIEAVVAESYDAAFAGTGRVVVRLAKTEEAWLFKMVETGREVTVDLDAGKLVDHRSGMEYKIKKV